MTPKEARGQIRQVAKETITAMVKEELYKALKSDVDKQMKEFEMMIKKHLAEMDQRHKDTMSYLVRSITTPSDKK